MHVSCIPISTSTTQIGAPFHSDIWPGGFQTLFMLNSSEYETSTAHYNYMYNVEMESVFLISTSQI